jgi:hypothetical protein
MPTSGYVCKFSLKWNLLGKRGKRSAKAGEGGCKSQVRYWTDNTVRPYQLRDRSQVSGYDYSKLLPKLTENQVSAAEDACDDVIFLTFKKKILFPRVKRGREKGETVLYTVAGNDLLNFFWTKIRYGVGGGLLSCCMGPRPLCPKTTKPNLAYLTHLSSHLCTILHSVDFFR